MHTYWIEFIIPQRCWRCCQQVFMGNSSSPPEMLYSSCEGHTFFNKSKIKHNKTEQKNLNKVALSNEQLVTQK